MARTKLKAIVTFAAILASNSAMAGNIGVKCHLSENPTETPLVSFEIANNASNRLVSDLQEVRSATDSETLPSFLVSQFKFSPSELRIEMDDGSSEGNKVVSLETVGARVPIDNGGGSVLYALWLGSYQRFDTGRQSEADVTCYAKEIQ